LNSAENVLVPEFTGMDVMASLKQDGRVGRKNIIVFTASSKETVDILLEQGAKEVLWKPCNLDEIKLLIDKYKN
jgi:CheY-like chemotaxis protein